LKIIELYFRPTVGLDPILRYNVWQFLMSSVENFGKTIILTTHYMNEANYCSRIGFIRNGLMLVEDCPLNIQSSFNTVDLDDALLMLCDGKEYESRSQTEDVDQECDFFENFKESESVLGLQRMMAIITEDLYFFKTRISYVSNTIMNSRFSGSLKIFLGF
jgi:ABC-type multidrug transport system ATPase subunit